MIIGLALVSDADTIEIGDVRIRLDAIDAPETAQTCPGGPPALLPCGRVAADDLRAWLGDAEVRCQPTGKDRYGRILARCSRGNDDVQAWLVSSGRAMAYHQFSDRYVADEEAARAANRGFWATRFEPPWDYRRRQRSGRSPSPAASGPSGCEIKGNITAKGDRIYHLPGSSGYARTRPEQWFCSEEQAQAAGFRAPRG